MTFLTASLLGEFFVDIPLALRGPFCITSSALVHYFLLVYFILTVAQSILVYLDLVVVLGTKELLRQYQLKAGLISWSKYLHTSVE